MTLEGLEVLLLQPDFATPPRLVGSQKVDVADLGPAAKVNAYIGDRPLHAFTHQFKTTSRATTAILEDFLTARAGRWQPFWLPSWHGELNPVAAMASGSSSLSITTVNYATVYDPTHANVAKLGHYIFLVHVDGTFLIRKVLSVSGSSPEVLTLDSPVTRAFELGNFAVGFVYCVALIADKVEFKYAGIDTASVSFAVAEETAIDESEDDSEEPDLEDPLVADFSSDVTSGDPPLDVQFTDESTGEPVSWNWNFGDGTAASTAQHPSHEFTNAGTYNVRLRVTDASGATSSITRPIVVNAPPEPPEDTLTADFSFTPTTGDAVLEVTFTDETIGVPTLWAWSFGDGTFSSLQNPVHSYALPGTYTLTLDVRDTNGATSRAVQSITVTEPTSSAVTCNSGASYNDYSVGSTSCAGCCTALDAMAVFDIMLWQREALEDCLGLTVVDGMLFVFNSKNFTLALDSTFNNGGSLNLNGVQIYDVGRLPD